MTSHPVDVSLRKAFGEGFLFGLFVGGVTLLKRVGQSDTLDLALIWIGGSIAVGGINVVRKIVAARWRRDQTP